MAKRNTTTTDSKMTLVTFILKEAAKKKYHLFYFVTETLCISCYLPFEKTMKLMPYTLIGYCIYSLLVLCFYYPLYTENLRTVLVSPLDCTDNFSADAGECCDTLVGVVANAKRAGIGAAASRLFHTQIIDTRRKWNSTK